MIYYERMLFKVYDQLISIAPKDVVCCKADDDWTIFCLSGNREVQINKPIPIIMNRLPSRHFMRVHKDWIINIHYIDNVYWEKNYLRMIDGVKIPLMPIMKFRLENILLENPIFCRELEWME